MCCGLLNGLRTNDTSNDPPVGAVGQPDVGYHLDGGPAPLIDDNDSAH